MHANLLRFFFFFFFYITHFYIEKQQYLQWREVKIEEASLGPIHVTLHKILLYLLKRASGFQCRPTPMLS